MIQVGSLQIVVEIDAQAIVSVRHDYQRPLRQISQLLITNKLEDSCELLPCIFSVCGFAHETAGKLAAGLLKESDSIAIQQKLLLENLREIIFRLVQVWGYPIESKSFVEFSLLISHCLDLGAMDANKKIKNQLPKVWNRFIVNESHYQQWVEQIKNRVISDCDIIQNNYSEISDTTDSNRKLIVDLVKNKYANKQHSKSIDNKEFFSGIGTNLCARHNLSLIDKIVLSAKSLFQEAQFIVSTLLEFDLQEKSTGDLCIDHKALYFSEQVDDNVQIGKVLTSRGWLSHTIRYCSEHKAIKTWDIEAPTDVIFGANNRSILTSLLQGLKLNSQTKIEIDEYAKIAEDGLTIHGINDPEMLRKIENLTVWLIKAIDPCLEYSVEVRYA